MKTFLFNIQTTMEVYAETEERALDLINSYPDEILKDDESMRMRDRDILLVLVEDSGNVMRILSGGE